MERAVKGIWIPIEIWEDERLTALDKFILAEIDRKDDGVHHCDASNEYLAKFCCCSESKVTKAIAKLLKLKYISTVKFDGRTRILKSNLHVESRGGIS